ncbi:MAG: hypothetical protein KAI69_04270 [Deltaproteobacteria bacterium]|nr:hypothetical protein [Deltaproteobacteria bacterium]
MIKWAPSRAGLSLLFLFLGLAVLGFDRYTYKHYSGAEIAFAGKATPAVAGTAVRATIKELKSKLIKSKVGAGRYEVTADQNLFAADRKAWQSPVPPPEATVKKDEALAPAAVPVRRDVILYGTYLSGKVKKAMLHFKRFRKGRILVAEGEQAKDEESSDSGRRKSPVYTVLKVEAKKVTLRDQKGSEFEVGLYDNKQRRPVRTDNKRNIKVDTASSSARKLAKSAKHAKAAPKERVAEPAYLSAAHIRKLSAEEKDGLVAGGELKKLNTPFGAVYKRIANE